MTNSVRRNRTKSCPPRATATTLCLTFMALVLAMSALAVPAGAQERSRHTAHSSLARRDVSVARLAPAHLAVVGGRLVWSSVSGAAGYVVRERVDGHETRRTKVATTAVSLRPVRGATVVYSVRTDAPGSAWSSPIAIVYNRLGEIAKISGEGSGGSGSTGSSPTEGSPPSEAGSPPAGGPGSGGTGGEGAGGTTSPEPEGTTGGLESEGETSLSKKTHSTGLKVGLIGGIYGWGAAAGETIRKATRVKYTRLSVGSEGWGTAKEMVGDGITPLILYNPTLAGMSPAAVAEGVKAYVSHMHELGLTEIELGNEVYFHGSTPWEYAAQYRAAHEALAGSGITLIADAWTDTQKANGQWSDWEYGGGWCVLFVQSLGYIPDAWSFHPYGPMKADGFGSGAYQPGWATVPRMIGYMKADHVYAPLNITEVGQPTYQGDDGNAAVSEAEQAQDVKQYIRQASEWGLASVYLYEGIDTPEGGYGLYKWPLKAKPSAAAFAEAIAELSTPGVTASLASARKGSLIN
jgi:hypothetical protein